MRRFLAVVLVLCCLLLIGGCSNPAEPTEKPAPAETSEPTGKTDPAETPAATVPSEEISFRGEEIPLNAELSPEQSLYLLDARGDRVLFTVWDQGPEGKASPTSRFTSSVFIYNTDTQQVETSWEPEIKGQYQSGVLTGEQSALCSVLPGPDMEAKGNVLVSLDSAQKSIAQADGMPGAVRRIGGDNYMLPYAKNSDGAQTYGLICVTGDSQTHEFDWIAEDLASTEIAVLGDKFCYIGEKDGKSFFVTADANGEICRNEFSPQQEKVTSFCLTPEGVLAGFETDEGCRCVLLRENSERTELELPGECKALYRLCANEQAAVCTDPDYLLWGVPAPGAALRSQEQLCADTLPLCEKGDYLSLFAADESSFYVYFGHRPALFRLHVSKAA